MNFRSVTATFYPTAVLNARSWNLRALGSQASFGPRGQADPNAQHLIWTRQDDIDCPAFRV